MSDELDKVVPRIKVKEGESLEEILEEKYGIVLKHVEQIKEYNKRLKWIVMLRPINKEVAGKLKSGARGKIISIKGKSSEFKFLAGDVPYNAGLSKLGKNGQQSDLSKIDHFNSVNAKSIENSNNNEKIKYSEQQIIGEKQEIEKRKQEITEKEKYIEELKKNIEQQEKYKKELESKNEESLLSKIKQELNLNQQQLAEMRKELLNLREQLAAEQQTLEKYYQEFNLSFKLSTIQKTVEIDGKTYGCFYKVGEDGRPEYENINKLGIQPVIYIKDIKDEKNNYFKVEYDEKGWSIDKNNPQQIDTKSIEELKIFSYKQYEKVDDDYKLINPPLTADYDQLSAAEIYNKDDQKFTVNDNIDSVVKYLKEEQEKLISFPADKYLRECKAAAERLSNGGTKKKWHK